MPTAEESLASLLEKLNALIPPPRFEDTPMPDRPRPIFINDRLNIEFETDTRTGRQIIAVVQRVTGTSTRDFHKHNRLKSFVEARQIAYWFMRYFTPLSYPQIGQMVGDRDHSTIMHGVKKINQNPEPFRSRMEAVAKVLKVTLPEEVPFQ